MRAKCIGALFLLLTSLVDLGAAGVDMRLVDAVKKGDTSAVRALLKEGPGVDVAEADGATALHWAVYRADVEATDLLIRAGAKVDAANRHGVRPLSLACANGSAQIVEKLLAAGADPHAAVGGEPPILAAARAGNVEVVKSLARYGADVNAKETWRGQTALMWAVAEEHPLVAQALIDLGANVRARSDGGGDVERPLGVNRPESTSGTVKTGLTPLLFAARQGALESTRVLIAAGADVNEKGPRGTNALLMAINNLHYELAAFLVESGAALDAADAAGTSALHASVQSETLPGIGSPSRKPTGRMDRVSLIKLLLAHGANPNARLAPEKPRDSNMKDTIADRVIDYSVSLGGATPFLLGARAADLELMRLLLAHGADPQAATVENTTPLAVAAGVGYYENLWQPPEDQVLQALRLLIELGNDVNLANKHGQTPMHGAVYRGKNALVEFLVGKGARVNATDALGRTPLQLAEEGFYQLASLIRRDSSASLLAKLGNDTPEAARLRRSNPTGR